MASEPMGSKAPKRKLGMFQVLFFETLVYFVCYLSLALSYRFAMPPECQRVALLLATNLQSPGGGNDAKCRLYRRTIIRYMVLGQVLTLRNVSMQVKKRFPTMDHVLEAGLIEKDELALMNDLETVQGDTKFWLVIEWSMAILNRARAEQKIASDYLMQAICEKLDEYRGLLGGMLMNDWINVPLIYTQIVTIAVWTYFLAGLLGNQWVVQDTIIDLYVPVFSIIQFICLLGWLRVAQNMLNPLGEADDDFELNYIIDRNLKVGMVMVDDACRKTPFLKLDAFYDDDNAELPHTEASLPTSHQVIKNSCADIEIEETAARIVPSINGSHASSIRNRGGSKLSLVSKIQPSIQRMVSRKASNLSGMNGIGGGGDQLTTVIEDWNSIHSASFQPKTNSGGHINGISGFGDQPDELNLILNGGEGGMGGSDENDFKMNEETVHHQNLNLNDLHVDGLAAKTADSSSTSPTIDNNSPGFGLPPRKLSTVTEESSESSSVVSAAQKAIPPKPSPNSTDSGNFTADSNATVNPMIRTAKSSKSEINNGENDLRVLMNNSQNKQPFVGGDCITTMNNPNIDHALNGVFCDTKDETIAKIL